MRSVRALLFAAAAYLLAAQLVAGELPPFSETNLPCHRLPVNVEPTRYELHLNFSSLNSDVYEGIVNISLNFSTGTTDKLVAWGLGDVPCARQYDPNTIVLHADKSVEIENITVISQSDPLWPFEKKQKNRKIVELVRDAAKQMIAIRVKHGLHTTNQGTPGNLFIKFKGRMRQDKRGVYFSTYNDGERVYKHIVSQFQPTFARMVFPCFDEPRFRVPFSVRVSHPRELTAYGNTEVAAVSEEDGLKTTRFVTTPDMPVHMVAFAIGEFDEPLEVISTLEFNEQLKIRVITERGRRETAGFASKVAQDLLKEFGLSSDDFPLNKLDIIAIADLDRNNTESWGLAFVRDTLLWVDDETKEYTRFTTALNIAHVVAHQLFGNLISPSWWSDLWITEGFAAQLSLEFVEYYYNDSKYLVRLEMLSRVLNEDQAGNLHPLSPSEENLQTSEQIYGLLDELQFMKSASMAQMVENAVGYGSLGRELIREYANKTINFQDYKRAVLGTDRDLSHKRALPDLLETFPKYVGVPLVNYFETLSYDLLCITPFNLSIRAMLTHGACENEASLEPQKVAIQVKGKILDEEETMIVGTAGLKRLLTNFPPASSYSKLDENPSIATYYRTRYPDYLYDRLQTAIEKQHMDRMDRLQILDDANSLVKAKLMDQEQFKSLLESYANEDDPGVVMAIMAATRTYRSLFPQDATPLKSDKAILNIFRESRFDADEDASLIWQRARELVLTAMVEEDREGVRAAALEAFEKTNGTVALFLREPIYKAVVLSGSKHVNQLLSHLWETKSYEERIRLVSALTLSKDTEVLKEVKSWLESSGLKEETTAPFLKSISAALQE